MKNPKINIMMLLILVTGFGQCQTKKEMKKSQQTSSDKDFWQAIANNDNDTFLAGDMGTLIWLDSDNKIIEKIKTDLDRPYITTLNNGYVAAGRWNGRVLKWDSKYKEQFSLKLFDGCITAISTLGNEIYAAGANKDTTLQNITNKKNEDFVKLLPGLLFRINEKGDYQRIDIKPKGLIDYLIPEEDWIAWVDSKEKNSIKLKFKDTEKQFSNPLGNINSLCKAGKTLFYIDEKGIAQLDPLTMENKRLYDFNIDLQVLKMIGYEKKFYLMTSEGVFLLPGEVKVNKGEFQPADISMYNDKILILKKEGTIIQIEKNNESKEYSVN